jgi:surface carbohydrate biosynthesis protein
MIVRNVDAVILVEKAARELDVACLIKLLARKKYGLEVEIIQQNCQYALAFKTLKPKVVFLPFCYQERSNKWFFLRWPKAIYFNLTYEQFFYPGNSIAKTPRGSFAINKVLHHSWSKMYANKLKAIGVPADHIYLNGNPFYQLYQKPYREFFPTRAELAEKNRLDPGKRWVFFPENYNWAFYGEDMLQQMVRDGQSPDQVREMREFATKSFEAAMRWCRDLVEDPSIELILRPRPSTAGNEFVERVRMLLGKVPPNFHMNQSGTVREWILASQAVISSYSTCLIEASLANKTIYMVEPFPLLDNLKVDWHRYAPVLRDRNSFLNSLTGENLETNWGHLEQWARDTILSKGDPIRNLVDLLNDLLKGRVKAAPRYRWRELFPPPEPYLSALKNYLRHWLSVRRSRKAYNGEVPMEYKADMEEIGRIPEKLARWDEFV